MFSPSSTLDLVPTLHLRPVTPPLVPRAAVPAVPGADPVSFLADLARAATDLVLVEVGFFSLADGSSPRVRRWQFGLPRARHHLLQHWLCPRCQACRQVAGARGRASQRDHLIVLATLLPGVVASPTRCGPCARCRLLPLTLRRVPLRWAWQLWWEPSPRLLPPLALSLSPISESFAFDSNGPNQAPLVGSLLGVHVGITAPTLSLLLQCCLGALLF